jgi:hypothetical protein
VSIDWELFRPASDSASPGGAPWLTPAVIEFLGAQADQRPPVIEGGSHQSASVDVRVLVGKSQMQSVTGTVKPLGSAAATNATEAPKSAPAFGSVFSWRGALSALQPLFSGPNASMWSAPAQSDTQVAVSATKTAKAPASTIGTDPSGGGVRGSKSVFSFLPIVPPLFAEWQDWDVVAPLCNFPVPTVGLSLSSGDEHHSGTVGIEASSVGASRPGPPRGSRPPGSNTTALQGHAPGGAKHGRSDGDAAVFRKPRWTALLQALNSDRRMISSPLSNLSAVAVAARLASCVVISALRPVSPGGGAGASTVVDWLLDAAWIARLSRGGVDAVAASSALAQCVPSSSSSAAESDSGGPLQLSVLKSSPRAVKKHELCAHGCDSCQTLAHTAIVVCVAVSRSLRAAEHVGTFGPLLVDSWLVAAVPAVDLIGSSPAVAAALSSTDVLSSDSSLCSPALPGWWNSGGDAPLRVDLWCCEALRCMALADCLFRVFEVQPPVVQVSGEVMTDKSRTAKPALMSAAPGKDVKKGSKTAGKGEAVPDAATVMAAVSAALRPIASTAGHLVAGLDSDVKASAPGRECAVRMWVQSGWQDI